MINAIKPNIKNYKFDEEEINKLSKVNIFVGANNSGKSRFMRHLLSNDINYKFKLEEERVINSASEILKRMISYKNETEVPIQDINDILSHLEESIHKRNVVNIIALISTLRGLINNYLSRKDTFTHTNKGKIYHDKIGQNLKEILDPELVEFGLDFTDESYKKNNFEKIYIPMLRGLRPVYSEGGISFTDKNVYEMRTKKDYFRNNELKNSKLFTGLDIYDKIKRMLLGMESQRELIIGYQKFLEKYFFDQEVLLIPNIDDDVLYIKIGVQEERPIYDVGDGLQTIILCTFPLFTADASKELLLFIEEPELTLHPEMQRKLIEVYCKEFKSSQIFVTTHSNHLLDISLDFEEEVSIYSFEKEEDETFNVRNVTDNKKVLYLLGIRNSSVFLSNCIIWVEGISDRIYIKILLDKYVEINKKNLEEDKHYSILEYGGGNITHFDFLGENSDKIDIDKINHNNFVMADNDGYDLSSGKRKGSKTTDEKGLRLKSMKENLDNFYAESIEVENLIPSFIYKEYFENLNEHENRKWEYDHSLLNSEEFDKKIKIEKIGKLLKEYFVKIKEGKSSEQFENSESILCIGDKTKIAKEISKIIEKVINSKSDFDKFPSTTKDLISKLINFIEESNS